MTSEIALKLFDRPIFPPKIPPVHANHEGTRPCHANVMSDIIVYLCFVLLPLATHVQNMSSAQFVLVSVIEGINSCLFSQLKCLQPHHTVASLRDETFTESGIIVDGGAGAVRTFIVPDGRPESNLDTACLKLSAVEVVTRFHVSEFKFKIARRVLAGAPPMGSEAAKERVDVRNAFNVLFARDPGHSYPDSFEPPKNCVEEMYNDVLKVHVCCRHHIL